MKRLMAATLLAPLLASTGCSMWDDARFVSQHKHKVASDFELQSLDGASVRLSNYRGRPVVLAFWGYG